MTLESRTELQNSSLCIHSIRLCVVCKNGHICAQLPIDVHKSAALLLFFASPLGGPKCTKIVKLSNISTAATRQHQQHHHASQFRKLSGVFPSNFLPPRRRTMAGMEDAELRCRICLGVEANELISVFCVASTQKKLLAHMTLAVAGVPVSTSLVSMLCVGCED